MDPLSVSPGNLEALGAIESCLEAGRWAELRSLIDLPAVWAWDRPLSGAEFHDAVAEVLEPAVDVQLLVLAALRRERAQGVTRTSYTCCLLWAYPGSWEDHELEFDIHLGYTGGGSGPFVLRYLGITAPTPEVIPFPDVGAVRADPIAPAGAPARTRRRAAPGPAMLMPEPASRDGQRG